MKKVYRITLWHGGGKTGHSSWTSDAPPKLEQGGILRFKSQDGLLHWVTGSIEVTEYEEAG